jgi:noranthrone synthase
LFMLPDGGGSASSYAPIPRLKADVAIIGLNCPYARDPENMNCTHTAMIESFCTEIRRRQPKGPYHLGGWSSGGAFAYVTAEALVNQGDEVHSLVIIDAPVPQVMEKLPVSFYEYCNTVGLFANQPGGSSNDAPPPYLVPHFVAVVDVMMDYKVAPLRTNRMPKVGIVWASETVMDEKTAPKMKGMHFMIQKRTDFGPDGWDEVMPGAEFDIVKANGANHFSLMVSLLLSYTRSCMSELYANKSCSKSRTSTW